MRQKNLQGIRAPKIIALSGYATVGKDTVGNAIITYYAAMLNKTYKRVAFADEVRKDLDPFIKNHYGFSCINCDKYQKRIIRGLMVGHGESKRKQNPEYWIYRVKQLIKEYNDGGCGVIITDLRYENEAQFVKDNGGVIIHLTRNGIKAPNSNEALSIPPIALLADYTMNLTNYREDRVFEGTYNKVHNFINKYFNNGK